LNLVLAYFMLRLFYRKEFYHCPFTPELEPLKDPSLARVARLSLILLVVLILTRVAVTLVNLPFDFRLTYIALIAALPVLLYTPKRPGTLRRMDWFTLIFFAAMFVLMQSVWDTGVIQSAMSSTKVDLTSTGMILGVSVFLSQLLSNVPLVALYLPVLLHLGAGTAAMMALAAGSTIAGNLTILGAASNVIIIQNAERRSGATLSFWEFVRIGVPLTAVNVAVYWLFLSL
jgi:Na+/H+ antiporter NhaD/arsenite permease-like protein